MSAAAGTITYLHLECCAILGYYAASGFSTPEDGTDILSRNFGKELTTTLCVMTLKSAVLSFFAAEDRNHSYLHVRY